MPRKIQRPDDAVALAATYNIKGGLDLSLDEVVVPVHVVNPGAFSGGGGGPGESLTSDRGLPGRRPVVMWSDILVPANGAGQVAFCWMEMPTTDVWKGRRMVINEFSISDSGGTAAFFHAGLGKTTAPPWFVSGLASSGQVFPAGPVGSRFFGELDQISWQTSSIAAGPFPGYNFGRWNKAVGNMIYAQPIQLNWELGDEPGNGTANFPGNNIFWLLNGTSNQNFRVNIKHTIYPGPNDF